MDRWLTDTDSQVQRTNRGLQMGREVRKLGGKVMGLRNTNGWLQNPEYVKYSLENIVKHV